MTIHRRDTARRAGAQIVLAIAGLVIACGAGVALYDAVALVAGGGP